MRAAWLVVVALIATAAAGAPAPDGRYYLFLDAPNPSLDHENVPSYFFRLDRNGAQWEPIFGGKTYGVPFGLIRGEKTDGDFTELDCLVLFFGEGREKKFKGNPEGSFLVEYTMRFRGEGASGISGSWRSNVKLATRDRPFTGALKNEGTLTGIFSPARPTGRPPAAPGEHPRFLFRRDDLPALKKNLATDWGKSMMSWMDREHWSRSSMAVGLGLLYRLTDKREYADRARDLIEKDMDSGWWLPISGIHDPGWKAVEGLYAYDLVHDTCDAAFHAKMRRLLKPQMHFLHNFCNVDRGNGADHANWSAQFQAGVAMCALTLLADPETKPEESPELSIARISPPADLKIEPGTPVLPRDGKGVIMKFLAAGPFDLGMGNDGLAELGGVAKARPTDGTTFKLKVKAEPTVESWDGLHPTEAKVRKGLALTRGDNLAPLTKEIVGKFRRISADAFAKNAAPKETKDKDKDKGKGKGKRDDLDSAMDDLLLTDQQKLRNQEESARKAEEEKRRQIEASISPWEWRAGSPAEGYRPSGCVDLWEAMGRRNWRTIYFYAVLDNPKPCYVKVDMQNQQRWEPCVYIAGRPFEKNDLIYMEPGKYPVMIPWTLTTCFYYHSHGRDEQVSDFTLQEVEKEEMERVQGHHKVVNEFRKACREKISTFYPKGAAPEPDTLMWLAHSRLVMDRWCSEATGDRGWLLAGDCYGRVSLMTAMPFMHAYRNATGLDNPRKPNPGWVVPQAVYRTVFSEDGAVMQSFGRGGGPIGVDLWARGFGLVPDDLKPMGLWGWTRTQKLADAGKLKAPELVTEELDPMSAAFAFVNRPPPGSGIEERNPGECAPLTVADTQFLGYTLRNRWRDKDDIVTLFTGFRHSGGDWPGGMVGEWRLAGLDAQWVVHAGGSMSSYPAMHILEKFGMEARERYAQFMSDGSGAMGLDLLDPRGNTRAARHFAVDYSGACGAPALIVTVDCMPPPPAAAVKEALAASAEAGVVAARPQLRTRAGKSDSDAGDASDEGATVAQGSKGKASSSSASPAESTLFYGGSNRWALVTLDENKVALTSNGFTITAPNGATLAGTVVAPLEPKLWTEEATFGHEINYWREHRGANFDRKIVQTAGGELIVVVMTLQKGPPPKVTASVQGDKAEIAVGGRVVTFDGKRLVLAKQHGP